MTSTTTARGTSAASAYADASTLTEVDVPAQYTADGPRTLTVRGAVIDKDGGSPASTTVLEVANVAPTAKLTGATVAEGSPATVTFSDAADVSAADVAAGFHYEFDLDGDGTFEVTGTEPRATLTADGPATLAVRGAIVDRDGGRSVYDTTVTVENVAPTVTLSGPADVVAASALELAVELGDASAGKALSATIDWGDGATQTLSGRGKQIVSHSYAASGAYSIRVEVTDGSANASATHAVSVSAPPPVDVPPVVVPPVDVPRVVVPPVVVPPVPVRIESLDVTPRCFRSAAATLTVRVRVSEAATARLRIERQNGKRVAKCPAANGPSKPAGHKVPGVISPSVGAAVRAGQNTIRLATRGRNGKRLKPGAYVLTVTVGNASQRMKLWVLAG